MNEDDYGYDSNGSDIDTWEDEQVFQDHEGICGELEDLDPENYGPEPREDFGYFGEMGMMEE